MKKRIFCIFIILLTGCAFPLLQRDNAEIQANFEMAMAQSNRILDDVYVRERTREDPSKWGKVKMVWIREDLKLVYLYLNKDGVYYAVALPMDDGYGRPPLPDQSVY